MVSMLLHPKKIVIAYKKFIINFDEGKKCTNNNYIRENIPDNKIPMLVVMFSQLEMD